MASMGTVFLLRSSPKGDATKLEYSSLEKYVRLTDLVQPSHRHKKQNTTSDVNPFVRGLSSFPIAIVLQDLFFALVLHRVTLI